MRKIVFWAIVLLGCVLPVRAQVFDFDRVREPMAVLNGPMYFHTGDDPDGKLGWARPDFDDSQWPVIQSNKSWNEQGYPGYGGTAWYRFKVALPTQHRRSALYIDQLMTSYQVFADGKSIGQFGGLPPNAWPAVSTGQIYLLPEGAQSSVTIAIRVWHRQQVAMYSPGGLLAAPRIGDANLVRGWKDHDNKSLVWQTSAGNYIALIELLAGLAGMALFLLRRSEREYLWFGASELLVAGSRMVDTYSSIYGSPVRSSEAIRNIAIDFSMFCLVRFLLITMRLRPNRWYWIAVGSAGAGVILTLPAEAEWLAISSSNLIVAVLGLLFTVAVCLLLLQGARRRSPDARLLLGPFAMSYASWIAYQIVLVTVTLGRAQFRPLLHRLEQLTAWPFPISLQNLTDGFFDISILAILVLRFARSRRDEERLNAELEAARAVQQVLIPEEIPAVPGYRIECVYLPAGQVGGDFFQVLRMDDGAVLVVVGDVSGKGMPAAMTVSLLVGTVRTAAETTASPAVLLSTLNRRLLGRAQGGFTTCLVLHIAADGAVTGANAGHLNPYLNGEERPVENGLPLGLSAEVMYAETRFALRPDDVLTLVTDGVVEARNAAGELFGFERTAGLATQQAGEMARVAKAFGQEDDITVVSLIRQQSAAEMPVRLETAEAGA